MADTGTGAGREGRPIDSGNPWDTSDGAGEALAVLATGLPVAAGPTFVQVLWLVMVIMIGLIVRFAHPPTDDHGDGGDDGGGGGIPTAPRPPKPMGTKCV
jgi:hypothetical protein